MNFLKGRRTLNISLILLFCLLVLKGWVLTALIQQGESDKCFAESMPEDVHVPLGVIEDEYCNQKVGSLLNEINQENQWLKEKRQFLEDQEKKVRLYKMEVKNKLEKLTGVRLSIEKMFNAIVKKQKENTGKLVKIYENMEPSSAAQKLDVMDEELAAWLLQHLNPRQSGAILDAMNPQKASRLTRLLKPKEPSKLMKEYGDPRQGNRSSAADKNKEVKLARKTAAAKKPARPKAPPVLAKGGKLIQVAAYNDAKSADRIIKRLQEKGYQCFGKAPASPKSPKQYFRVFVGPFPNKKEALRVKVRLEKNEGLKGIFIRSVDKS